ISIESAYQKEIDSVKYFYDGDFIGSRSKNSSFKTVLKAPLGRRLLSAQIFGNWKPVLISKRIVLHNDKAPQVYTYKIINTYPHDPLAFTQGLEFYNDTLYEGTGLHGVSSLRKVDLKTGKVLKETKLDR